MANRCHACDKACKKSSFNLKFWFQISEDAARDEYGRIITGPKARVDKSEITNAYRIYVSNLPLDIKWQDVKDIFRSRIGDVSHCKLFTDQVIFMITFTLLAIFKDILL